MKTWGIFHGDRDGNLAKQFTSSMDECFKQTGFENAAPALFPVKGGMNAEAWKREIKSKMNNNVQAVVLILPGSKGKCPLYDEVKKFLLTDFSVPS